MNPRPFTIEDLLHLARLYSQMGSSVQDQFDAILSEGATQLNPNALTIIRDFLQAAVKKDVEGADDLLDIVTEMIGQ